MSSAIENPALIGWLELAYEGTSYPARAQHHQTVMERLSALDILTMQLFVPRG